VDRQAITSSLADTVPHHSLPVLCGNNQQVSAGRNSVDPGSGIDPLRKKLLGMNEEIEK
jgi:hypothetical protein